MPWNQDIAEIVNYLAENKLQFWTFSNLSLQIPFPGYRFTNLKSWLLFSISYYHKLNTFEFLAAGQTK